MHCIRAISYQARSKKSKEKRKSLKKVSFYTPTSESSKCSAFHRSVPTSVILEGFQAHMASIPARKRKEKRREAKEKRDKGKKGRVSWVLRVDAFFESFHWSHGQAFAGWVNERVLSQWDAAIFRLRVSQRGWMERIQVCEIVI